MTHPTSEHSRYVNHTFIRIARHYDFMNRLMSGGADLHWRKEAIHWASINPGDRILDVGAGTGDLSRAVRSAADNAQVIASDFTFTMLTQKNDWQGIHRCNADAMQMPFSDQTFNLILSGFLLRNVDDVDQALQEQYRMLKPGGKVIVLDTTKPRKSIFLPLVNFYLNKIIPILGVILTGDKEAYTYLPRSTQHFLRAEELAEKMAATGFKNIEFRIKMLGSVAIHQASKPEQS